MDDGKSKVLKTLLRVQGRNFKAAKEVSGCTGIVQRPLQFYEVIHTGRITSQ
jgi:hypothetical protein